MKTINICMAILVILATINIASAGIISQWANSAIASSQWQSSDWSAMQATGAPNTNQYGDLPTAWAASSADSTTEWLELEYGIPVKPTGVKVHETWGAGSLTKVEIMDENGNYETVWQGTDPNLGKRDVVWSEITFPERSYKSNIVKLTITTDAVLGEWEEIDAVELSGDADNGGPPIPEVPTIMMVSVGMIGLLYIGHRKR